MMKDNSDSPLRINLVVGFKQIAFPVLFVHI